MRTHPSVFAFPICLPLLLAMGCKQSTPTPPGAGHAETAPNAVADGSKGESAKRLSRDPSAAVAPADTSVECGGVRSALASCAEAKICDDDITFYLPAASRSALIALEKSPGYSGEAFDRYCLSACTARNDEIDEKRFADEVCGASLAAKTDAIPKVAKVVSFALRGELIATPEGIPLALITQKFGEPKTRRDSPYDCGSAFGEGTTREFVYDNFVLETDGSSAVVRSVLLDSTNRIVLADGQSLGSLDEGQFKGFSAPLRCELPMPIA